MADNTNAPGFRFLRMRNGADRPTIELRDVASTYSVAIFKGDPLCYVDGVNTVVPAAAGTVTIIGVCDGVEQYLAGGEMRRGNYLPASTAWTLQEQRSIVRVINARDAVFEIQTNNTGGTAPNTLATWNACVGGNFDHVAVAGSTVSGRSNYLLDVNATAVANCTGAAQWRVVGFDRSMQRDVNGSNFKLQVEVNESYEPQFSTTTEPA
jgi:hypothetical protein